MTENGADGDDADAANNTTQIVTTGNGSANKSGASAPRKRGRPSKKAKQQEEQLRQQQSAAQKRVRFQFSEKVNYQSGGEESEEKDLPAGDGDDIAASTSMGATASNEMGTGVDGADKSDRQQAATEDYSTGYRKSLGDFEEYVKMMNDEHISSQFELFT